MIQIVRSFEEVRAASSGRVALVPTMGFLHEGHLSLVDLARSMCDTLVVSVFVNPLQFGDPDDLRRYPRDLERDVLLLADRGTDLVLAPALNEMYPRIPPSTRITVEAISITLEGRSRPGHFDGVATVVAKLLGGVRPHLALFGQKDAQQLALIRRLADDLAIPVSIVGGPIVREQDGLALSSRNVFLSLEQRFSARSLSVGLMAAAEAVEAGERESHVLEEVVADMVRTAPHAELDYAELTDAVDVIHLPSLDREAFLAVAATVGGIRLIDNIWFDSEGVPDRGVRLTAPSILYGEES